MTIALIDMDKIVYSAACGAEKREHGKVVSVSPVSHALQNAKMLVNSVLNKTQATDYYGFLTSNDRSNFRFKVATIKPYKGKRPEKPTHYQAVRDYLETYWDANVITGMEADDALAIELTRLGDSAVCCSDDKDLRQVPGRHYIIRKDEFVDIDQEQGWRNFFTQTLVGDSSDNIPGVLGIGPKKAEKALQNAKDSVTMYTIIEDIYKTRYKDGYLNRLNEVCSLLYLLRSKDDSWYKCEDTIMCPF